jgi:hypothetical protein
MRFRRGWLQQSNAKLYTWDKETKKETSDYFSGRDRTADAGCASDAMFDSCLHLRELPLDPNTYPPSKEFSSDPLTFNFMTGKCPHIINGV